MKLFKAAYLAGGILSLAVGLWHFSVPQMFQWFSYIEIPEEAASIKVGINWINLCFSLLLTGLSLIALLWHKKCFSGSSEAVTVYTFLTLVWLFRVGLAVFYPWPLKPVAWTAILQLVMSIVILLLLLAPCVKLNLDKFRGRSRA